MTSYLSPDGGMGTKQSHHSVQIHKLPKLQNSLRLPTSFDPFLLFRFDFYYFVSISVVFAEQHAQLAAMERTPPTPRDPNQTEEALEALVRADPTIPYRKCLWPVFDFLYTQKLQRVLGIDPRTILAAYGGLGALLLGLPKQPKLLRSGLFAAGLLPLLGTATLVGLGARMVCTKRKPALRTSQDTLLERIREGRAKREPGFDVYYPASGRSSSNRVGMIFFPGALVNHTGYSEIAAGLSDKGILVVVLSLEPVRFVLDLETNRQLARAAIASLLPDWPMDEWVLAGHSAGGITALNTGVEIDDHPLDPAFCNRLVVCGVGMETNHGSLRTTQKPFEVLLVNGTEDGLVNRHIPGSEAHDRFVNYLLPPPEDEHSELGSTRFVSIEGGNHCQFADYPLSPPDGEAKVSSHDQKRIFVDKTAEFLLG